MEVIYQAELPRIMDALEEFYRVQMRKWALLDCQSSADGTEFLVRVNWNFSKRVNLKPVSIWAAMSANFNDAQLKPPPWGDSTVVPYEFETTIHLRSLSVRGDQVAVQVVTTEQIDPLCSVLTGGNGKQLLAPSMLNALGIEAPLHGHLTSRLGGGTMALPAKKTFALPGKHASPVGAKALVNASFGSLTALGIFDSFVESGRFREPNRSAPKKIFSRDDRALAHYAACQGALYESREQWQAAFRFVESFTKKGRERHGGKGILLPTVFGAFGGVKPKTLFDKVCHGFNRRRFSCLDKDEVNLSAVFSLTEACKTLDLPEPYGKWLQLEMKRPQWSENDIDLEFEARARVYTGAGGETYLDFTFSTFALPLLRDLGGELSAALNRRIDLPDDRRLFNGMANMARKSRFTLALP
jgi:hypothetical protein